MDVGVAMALCLLLLTVLVNFDDYLWPGLRGDGNNMPGIYDPFCLVSNGPQQRLPLRCCVEV